MYDIYSGNIQTVSNHPVHIYNEDGKLSPSAFIPFCAFGLNMSAIGVMMEDFELPICNSFRPSVRSDQLCYEIDLEKYKSKTSVERDLKSGLVLSLDYNEDREVLLDRNFDVLQKEDFVGKVDGSQDDEKASIYLDTIGKGLSTYYIIVFLGCFTSLGG